MAVICGVLLASLASAWRETNRHFESKQAEISGIAAAIAVPIAPPLAAGNRRSIAIALNAIGRVKSINYARVLNSDGQVFYELGSGVLISRGANDDASSTAFGPFDAIYYGAFPFQTPIVYRGQTIGALELIVDLSDMRDLLWISAGQALLFGLIAALFGMVVSKYSQRRIAEPIVALTGAMHHVQTQHDFSYRAQRISNDETGELVDAFNAMLDEIRQRDQALADHRENLEATVKQRTADLVVAKEEADEANAAKSQFLATMSHEIRTPMNGMLATAELLTSSGLPAKQKRHAEIIVRSGKGLLAIINDILDLSKVEAGKLQLESVPVDLATLADDAVQLFSGRAREKNIDLCAYVAPDVPSTIVGDPVRMSQILANLINNALKFTETGHVLLRMELVLQANDGSAPAHKLSISVEDTGIGIAEDKLSGIFDAFVQADSSVARSYGGTGIGLAICKRLADEMDGDLVATSQYGKGSTFTLTMPIEADLVSNHRSTQLVGRGKTAAIVLEPSATRDVLQAYLEDAGFVTNCYSEEPDELERMISADVLFATEDVCLTMQGIEVAERPEFTIALRTMGTLVNPHASVQNVSDAELSCPVLLGDLDPLLCALADGPQAVHELSRGTAGTEAAQLPRFDGIHVLAADDNEVNLEILREALDRLGITADCVEDGSQAVEAYKAGTYDLILMDVSMPVLDGYGATAQIRQHEAGSQRGRTPIIALTAHAYGSEANIWHQSDMDACVTKPFTLKSLEEKLTQLLPASAASEESSAIDNTKQSSPNSSAVETATKEQPELLDLAVLEGIAEMQREGDDLVARIIGLYTQHAPAALQKLLDLGDDASADEVASAAHALKSLSRNIGALLVGNLCDEIENEARAGRSTVDEKRSQEISRALDATLVELSTCAPGAARRVERHQA